MEDLIKITEHNGKQIVSARDLYSILEIRKHFTEWMDDQLSYFENYVDYQAVHLEVKAQNGIGGTKKLDYAITLDMAKELCMLSRTPKGKEVRRYFIECERKLNGQSKYRVPLTYAEALRELADKTEREEKLAKALEQAKPKVDFFDQVADSKDAVDLGIAAKSLNCGIGRNKLFEFLRDNSVLMANNIPYQSYCDKGWFRVIEQKYSKPDGTIHITTKTLLYQKGLQAISKMLSKPTEKNL